MAFESDFLWLNQVFQSFMFPSICNIYVTEVYNGQNKLCKKGYFSINLRIFFSFLPEQAALTKQNPLGNTVLKLDKQTKQLTTASRAAQRSKSGKLKIIRYATARC